MNMKFTGYWIWLFSEKKPRTASSNLIYTQKKSLARNNQKFHPE
jgi:hypothetical protein